MGVITGAPPAEGSVLVDIPSKSEDEAPSENLKEAATKDGRLVYDSSGKFQYALAPNGERSNLDEEMWLLVRTENFTGWFGDWESDPANASKVVDENGEPMVLVRGTDEDMAVPNTNRKITEAFGEVPVGTEYKGLFFSNNTHYSSVSGGDNVYIVFLNIRSPKFFDDLNTRVVVEEQAKGGDEGYDGFVGAEDGVFTVKDGKPAQIMSYVPFKPNQIKSVKNETFDPSSENIYE